MLHRPCCRIWHVFVHCVFAFKKTLFVSDVPAELDAASETGVPSLRCVRPGNVAQPPSDYAVIESFDETVA
jgi:methionine salvage enolase-phosphatase E1